MTEQNKQDKKKQGGGDRGVKSGEVVYHRVEKRDLTVSRDRPVPEEKPKPKEE